MIQISHGDDLNLDPPISSHAEKIVKETFNFKNISGYNISLVFVSDEYLSDLKKKYFKLSHKNRMQVLIPPNYLNGYLCLTKECVFHYKLSYNGKYVDKNDQFSIRWNDPKININWPVKKPILSLRDKKSKFLI